MQIDLIASAQSRRIIIREFKQIATQAAQT